MKDYTLAFLILELAFLLAANIEPIPGSEECRYDGPMRTIRWPEKAFVQTKKRFKSLL